MCGIVVAWVGLGAGRAEDELLADFRTEMEPLLDLYCMDCHGYGSSKGGVVLDEWASDEDLQNHELWLRVLKNVRGGIMPPPEEIQPYHDEREVMVDWIKTKAFQLDTDIPTPGESRCVGSIAWSIATRFAI